MNITKYDQWLIIASVHLNITKYDQWLIIASVHLNITKYDQWLIIASVQLNITKYDQWFIITSCHLNITKLENKSNELTGSSPKGTYSLLTLNSLFIDLKRKLKVKCKIDVCMSITVNSAWLHLVGPFKEGTGYNIKQCDGQATVMLEIWKMWNSQVDSYLLW